jgi:hypothetical protein
MSELTTDYDAPVVVLHNHDCRDHDCWRWGR